LFFLSSCNSSSPDNNFSVPEGIVARWSRIAVDTSGVDHSEGGAREHLGPTRASRAMAMVHIAMHYAIQSIEQKYQTYTNIQDMDIANSASIEAAVIKAASDILLSLYPKQENRINSFYNTDMELIDDNELKNSGINVGRNAARAIIENRTGDGSDDSTQSESYTFSDEPGKWRVDPTNIDQGVYTPNWSKVRPFMLNSASQFRAPPPPVLSSARYARSYAEAYALGGNGIETPTERTDEQTLIGIYWAYDGTPSLCAPTRMYNQIINHISKIENMTNQADLARLLALANIALADAGLASWDSKYFYNFWRPITAIREADLGTGPSGKGDGNSLTRGDPNFTPIGAPASNLFSNNFTPPFPTYVSGHATFGGALFQTLRNFFGKDDIRFSFTSDELNGKTADNSGTIRPLRPRFFSSLSEAELENGQSRVFLGIHFDFDSSEGIIMGNKVADLVFNNTLQAR